MDHPVGEAPMAQQNGNAEDEVIMHPQKPLGTIDVACLIINKMIGAGIFVSPPVVTSLVGNKVGAIFLWIFGGIFSYISIYIYLEYGLAWPYNGGEFLYISKIFPVPPLLFACSFAWAFVAYSTSVANAFNFALFADYPETDKPNEWKIKFIACVIVVAVAALHYRKVNLGILANNTLALYKVLFLTILTFAGFIVTCIDGAHGQLQGLNDYATTKVEHVTPTNVVLALLMVLFSYDGWENANYVTSEIDGNAEEKRRILKKGALIAISVVTVLYILFNIFLYFLLDFDTITKSPWTNVATIFAERAFRSNNPSMATAAIHVCIAFAALGNLIGVFFTNGRVKRDIARSQLIPFYKYFGMSSKYGTAEWDGLGTPTGGLILHGLVTCITVVATPFYPNGNTEGITFITNMYTYAHAFLRMFLALGLLSLRTRMRQYQTGNADPPDRTYDDDWDYGVIRSAWLRYAAAIVFFLINGLVVAMPFDPTNNPDGSARHIPTWVLPVIVLPTYVAGALFAVWIICFVPGLEFHQSKGPTEEKFVSYYNRRWMIEYPKINTPQHWWLLVTPLPWEKIRERFKKNGEAETAENLRTDFNQEMQ